MSSGAQDRERPRCCAIDFWFGAVTLSAESAGKALDAVTFKYPGSKNLVVDSTALFTSKEPRLSAAADHLRDRLQRRLQRRRDRPRDQVGVHHDPGQGPGRIDAARLRAAAGRLQADAAGHRRRVAVITRGLTTCLRGTAGVCGPARALDTLGGRLWAADTSDRARLNIMTRAESVETGASDATGNGAMTSLSKSQGGQRRRAQRPNRHRVPADRTIRRRACGDPRRGASATPSSADSRSGRDCWYLRSSR